MDEPKKEYLSKIQQDQKAIGARLKAIRIKNGIELKDIYDRTGAECIERGQFVDAAGQTITARHLVQYCHEIGASLGPYNKLPEELCIGKCEHPKEKETADVSGLKYCGQCGASR